MNAKQYSTKNLMNGATKPFCKVCFDTGKTEKEYTSHFVRESADPKSKVCCPTLLDMECRFCHMKGHTVSKCARRMICNDTPKGRHNTNLQEYKCKPQVSLVPKKSTKNLFSLLSEGDSDSDDENDVATYTSMLTNDTLDTFYSSDTIEKPTSTAFTYRDALNKPAPTPSIVDTLKADGKSISANNDLSMFIKYKYSRPGSWADSSDSDEE
jgi:hypothetical protein